MMLLLADALPVVDVGCLSLHRPNLRPLSHLSSCSSPKFPHAPPEYLLSCTTLHNQSATQVQSLLAFRLLCLSLSLAGAVARIVVTERANSKSAATGKTQRKKEKRA